MDGGDGVIRNLRVRCFVRMVPARRGLCDDVVLRASVDQNVFPDVDRKPLGLLLPLFVTQSVVILIDHLLDLIVLGRVW